MENVRAVLVNLLTHELGTTIDTSDPDMDDGWLTAHVALRAVEWVLDAAGYGPVGRGLGTDDAVDALAAAHRRYELASDVDETLEWPPPAGSYVALIETVLGADLASMPAGPLRPAPVRFAAPNDERLIWSIEAATEFGGRFDPASWLVQPRIGHHPHEPDPAGELDRFIAHWGYRRDYPNPWVEIGRDDALAHVIALQRTSLVWSARPWWDPGADAARDRADRFFGCFTGGTRYFTNGHGYRSDNHWDGNHFTIDPGAMLDTGIVLAGPRITGLWWHSEGDPRTPLGMSP